MKKKSKLTIAAILAASLGAVNADLVAHYSFDDGTGTTATNSIDSSNNGTQNAATIAWDVGGQIGGAVNFLSNATMDIPIGLDASTTEFTMSLWVNPRSFLNNDGIFTTRENGLWGFVLINSPGESPEPSPQFRVNNNANQSIPNTIIRNQWNHLALTWVNDGTRKIYINGTLINESTVTTATSFGATSAWLLGADSFDLQGPRTLDGLVDDLAIYNNRLSDDEITEIYENGLAGVSAFFPAGDNDKDGLDDSVENNNGVFTDATMTGTDPANKDTDDDGRTDGAEVRDPVNPTNPVNADSDNDTLSDGVELRNGLDPNDSSDAGADGDGDGLSAVQELEGTLNPFNAAGVNVGVPPSPDPTRATSPDDSDSDGDGVSDGDELLLTQGNMMFRAPPETSVLVRNSDFEFF